MSAASTPLTPRRSGRKHVKKKITDFRLRNWRIKFIFGVSDPLFTDFSLHIEGERTDTYDYWTTSAVISVDLPNYVKTAGGTLYSLEGGPDKKLMIKEGFPARLINLFSDGFPENWMSICLKFVSALKKLAPGVLKAAENSQKIERRLPSPIKSPKAIQKENRTTLSKSLTPKRSPVARALNFLRSSAQKARKRLSPKKSNVELDTSTPKIRNEKGFSPRKTIYKLGRLSITKSPKKTVKRPNPVVDDVENTPVKGGNLQKIADEVLLSTPSCSSTAAATNSKSERKKVWRLEQTQTLKTALDMFHPTSEQGWKNVAAALNDKFTIEECRQKAEKQFKYTVEETEKVGPKEFFDIVEKMESTKFGTLKHMETKEEMATFLSRWRLEQQREKKTECVDDSASDDSFAVDVINAAKQIRRPVGECNVRTPSRRQYIPIPVALSESASERDRKLDEEFAVPDWSNRQKVIFRLRNHRPPTRRPQKPKEDEDYLMNSSQFSF
ncbi:unnamed protein product [Bursaphelenchus xylophilus]|uniref:(pine wood nematode) hypothetical protein n=1 Tax=Bursaphelenchus xylophilus TaxID=6326 RepID=A0A1I7RI30_BURXY|nr:unnamed protein product [Bursaphelenchus xylophilus]CAG9115194.1 unnamed protein product [Bursaphelenchus xylophilus]